ncbi:hypothetical protein QTH97_35525 [Variovorax sp. J22R24]|uniref:hypothetical protein n=1 Tax=Variovorax gracilis TaxID=3053502 RepID=UPI002575F9A6|nr:hypothetical protein [Variovorax sp. J22R24]MDM0110246.1 hypothetical protein [Variovorax sp. J22R24]
MDMLRRLASAPLPANFHDPADIGQTRVLRERPGDRSDAGAVGLDSLVGHRGRAQVLSITEEGREALETPLLPGDRSGQRGRTTAWSLCRLNALGASRHAP